MTARGGDRTVAAPRARRGWPAILVSVVLATAFTSFAAPTASAHDDPWDDDDAPPPAPAPPPDAEAEGKGKTP